MEPTVQKTEKTQYEIDIHNKTNDLVVVLAEMFAKYKDNLGIAPTATDEERKKQVEVMTDMSIELMNKLSKTDLQWTQVALAFKKFENIVTTTARYVMGTLDQWDNEATSRLYGVKDENGKFRKEEVSVAKLAAILADAREKTGNDINDYINDLRK
jgi:hypothetical protein